MNQKMTETKVEKLFSPWMVGLCLSGLLINLILSKLVILLELPLYIDNVGSILTAALGGALPGMAVGFLSNLIGSVSEPISMYYGILTVLIAWIASIFSRCGKLKTWRGWLEASGCFVLIGGAVGSLMTWFLYGSQISGIAKPYAMFFYQQGFPAIFAQLTADVLVDIPDKLITVGIVCMVLHFYPNVLHGKFPLSSIYERKAVEEESAGKAEPERKLKHSVNYRMTSILVAAVVIISVMALTIGTVYHHQRLISTYENFVSLVAHQAAACIDGDQVMSYLEQGEDAPGYLDTRQKLSFVLDNANTIEYLYVYHIEPDGCHVVFELDTSESKGDPVGTVLTEEKAFTRQWGKFLKGEEVAAEYSRTVYGAFLTAYVPVHDQQGTTVAYVCADINLLEYIYDLMTYVIQVLSVLFAISMLIFTMALWYVNQHITTPVQMIVQQTEALDAISPEKWLDSEAWHQRVPVQTGDEIEQLYHTVFKVEENASHNVQRLIETEQKLLQSEELERINKELGKAMQQADEANQAKTDFLSRMSHDIRTPMNAILGTVVLAKDEMNDAKALGEALETIEASGKFLLGLINDILDINKIESGKIDLRPEPYTDEEFQNTIESTFLPLMEKKNLTFIFKANTYRETVFVDKLRYNQIFFNLLSNAVKYTQEGGQIEFLSEEIKAPEGMVGIRSHVRDNGIGMSESYREQLFEPFTRDSNAQINQTEGSGLGLAIVKNIVDAMGGTMQVNSKLGKGSEFIVDLCLPIVDNEEITEKKCAKYDDKILQGKSLLLVEDNKTNIIIAKKLLEKKGCIVTVALNGQEALETYCSSKEGEYDLILMDLRMPVMGGIEATKQIRSSKKADAKSIPIVAMTADAFNEDIHRTREAGMNAHLTKPIDPKLMYETLARQLALTQERK